MKEEFEILSSRIQKIARCIAAKELVEAAFLCGTLCAICEEYIAKCEAEEEEDDE